MIDAAARFQQRVLIRQAFVGAATYATIAIFAPKLIVLEMDVAIGVLTVGLTLALLALATTATMSFLRIRDHRFVVRSLALGSAAVEPDDLGKIAALPSNLTLRYFVASSLYTSLILIPGFRPDKLDDGRALSLLILAITILGASAIPHYVLTRQATTELIELSPLEPLGALLDADEGRDIPSIRVRRRLLLAVVAPVALVGVGAILVAHAHLRTLTEQTRRQTALVIARTALEPTAGASNDQARTDAIAAAARFGFVAKVDKVAERASVSFTREADGQIAVRAPVDDGQAEVRFTADLDPANTTGGAAVGIVAVIIAALLGSMFGKALANDLTHATSSVRLLGTENVIRGTMRVAPPARFAVVSSLGRAIDGLTERFRIFAAAQERALNAREAAQRMRGLLFASVSHDLKSPLNAILGFAELVGREQLTSAQRESLELITKRGRELLGLIETILDAARVEAGQLTLMQRSLDVGTLISEAIKKARELTVDVEFPVVATVAEELPTVPVDRAYATRALAVIVAHACRTAHADATASVVSVRADAAPALPRTERVSQITLGRVRIDIEYGSRDVTKEELEALFARQATARGRGLTLGLSLARSIIELHGGSVDVDGAPSGAPVCHVYLPLEAPGLRPRLSSVPSLG